MGEASGLSDNYLKPQDTACSDDDGMAQGTTDFASDNQQQPACSCDGCTTQNDDVIPDEELLYDLADLFKIFSDTTRIKILYYLMNGERCVVDIAQATSATQSAVSHQLRILKQAHLVRYRRDGRSVLYTLADDHVRTILSQGMTHICE